MKRTSFGGGSDRKQFYPSQGIGLARIENNSLYEPPTVDDNRRCSKKTCFLFLFQARLFSSNEKWN